MTAVKRLSVPPRPIWTSLLHLVGLFLLSLALESDEKGASNKNVSSPPSHCVKDRLKEGTWGASQEVAVMDYDSTMHGKRQPLAFAIPTHPPTFHFTLELLYAHHLHPDQFSVYLIFTTPDDAALYRHFLAQTPRQQPNSTTTSAYTLPSQSPRLGTPFQWESLYTPLILQWPCHSSVDLADRRVIITAKKLYALALLHACYDVITTFDAEAAVIKPASVQAAILAAAHQPKVIAAHFPNYADMLQASVAMFPPSDIATLARLTLDFALWPWWTDIPTWLSRDVPAFLQAIDFPARPPAHFNEFDHLTYTMWRVLHRNASLVNAMGLPGVETLDGPFGNTALAQHYAGVALAVPPGPAWMTHHFCSRNPTLCAHTPGIVMVHHTDRGDAPWWRSNWEEGTNSAAVEDESQHSPQCPRAGHTALVTPLLPATA